MYADTIILSVQNQDVFKMLTLWPKCKLQKETLAGSGVESQRIESSV